MRTLSLLIFFAFVTFIFSCESFDDDQPGLYSDAYYGDNVGSGDNYQEYVENPFVSVEDAPISTFSIDADGASYANVRRFLFQDHMIPPKGAIRTEELINYFDLQYPYSGNEHPIALNGEVSWCPWSAGNKLIRVGIQGKPIPNEELPNSNFVFLIDVSGSMGSEDKLDLLKSGFDRFVDNMRAEDRVAIVSYAGSAGVVLPSTPGTESQKIKEAIASLGSGGSTAGAEGIITAYQIAEENYISNGNNRIILGTDGDFNVGPSSTGDLIKLIEEKRNSGVFLTVLGVGRGNYNDHGMEQLANKGNGTFEYIDHIEQLKKVFVYDYSKFYTVAKDVKVQVKFNPELVESYRLIGYENRLLESNEFEDDSTDAGEIGSGQNITALYEIIPKAGDPGLRNSPTFTIDFRYKMPDSDTSTPLTLEIMDQWSAFSESSPQMKFVSAVASFAMLLRDSDYKGQSEYESVIEWIERADLQDTYGFKAEFKELVIEAQGL